VLNVRRNFVSCSPWSQGNYISTDVLSGKSEFVRCSLSSAIQPCKVLLLRALHLAGAFRSCRLPCLQAASSPLCLSAHAALLSHGSSPVRTGASLCCPPFSPSTSSRCPFWCGPAGHRQFPSALPVVLTALFLAGCRWHPQAARKGSAYSSIL